MLLNVHNERTVFTENGMSCFDKKKIISRICLQIVHKIN